MKAALQRKGKALYPFSKEDEEKIMEYTENQIINGNLTGVKIPRSYEQLKLYFACCQKVSENINEKDSDADKWQTKEDVDRMCRVMCRFIKDPIVSKGVVYIELRSVSYDQLSHLKACNYFDRALAIMAKKIGVEVDELTAEANNGS